MLVKHLVILVLSRHAGLTLTFQLNVESLLFMELFEVMQTH